MGGGGKKKKGGGEKKRTEVLVIATGRVIISSFQPRFRTAFLCSVRIFYAVTADGTLTESRSSIDD